MDSKNAAMDRLIVSPDTPDAVPIYPVAPAEWARLGKRQPKAARAAAETARFTAAAGQVVVVWGPGQKPERVFFGLGETPAPDPAIFRSLSASLPEATYRIAARLRAFDPSQVALAWALGTYRFDRYKSKPAGVAPRLVASADCDVDWVLAAAEAMAEARDLINTPANDMGPAEIEGRFKDAARAHGAALVVTVGDRLATEYPAVHAVGRAADPARAPRMIELTWGETAHPLVALVGKGVVFDSGGLDIKPAAGMRLMKKDMGGAAHVLALARMIMSARLAVRLAVLAPVVENAISGDAMRPGDVLASRSGLTIEVGNTDAEGRLILADALTRAGELGPVLTIDMATLTGAARVAVGPNIAPFFTSDEGLASDLAAAAAALGDPLWRLPIWEPYAASLDSDIADIKNDPDPWSQAGSISAALFLKRFAPTTPWVHFDIFAWNPRARPGFAIGAEVQAIRALFAVIEARF
jgi:leucyl aminopeptidase